MRQLPRSHTHRRARDHTSAAATASSSSASAGAAATWALVVVLRAELGSTICLVCPWLTGAVAVGSTVVGGAGAPCVVVVDAGVSATGPAAGL